MKTKYLLTAALLLTFLVPAGLSVPDGTPPTFSCSHRFLQTTSSITVPSVISAASSPGGVYVLAFTTRTTGAPTTTDPKIYAYDRACNQLWTASLKDLCGTNSNTCFSIGDIKVGHDRYIYHAITDAPNSKVFIVRYSPTGERLNTSINLATLGVNPIPNGVDDIDTFGTNPANLRILATARIDTRILRLSYDLQTVEQNVAGGTDIERIDTPLFLNDRIYTVVDQGAPTDARTFQIRNGTTLSVLGSLGGIKRPTDFTERPPRVSHTNNTEAYLGSASTSSCSPDCIRWRKVNSGTMAAVGGEVTPTDSQIRVGATLEETRPFYWDLAGDDSIMVCGTVNHNGPGEALGFVSRFKTIASDSVNAQSWNVTIDEALINAGSNVPFCHFDYANGFWALVQGYDAGAFANYQIYHYTGGEFTQPTARDYIVINLAPSVPPAQSTGNPLGQALGLVSTSWGFDASWLFGIVIVGLVTAGFARISQTPLLIGIGAFLGVGVGVALGLFEVWVIFVLIFIIIAIAGARLFGGGDDSAE